MEENKKDDVENNEAQPAAEPVEAAAPAIDVDGILMKRLEKQIDQKISEALANIVNSAKLEADEPDSDSDSKVDDEKLNINED